MPLPHRGAARTQAWVEALEPRVLLSAPQVGEPDVAAALVQPAAAALSVTLDGNAISPGGAINFGNLPQGYSSLLVITNSGDAPASLNQLRLPFNSDIGGTSVQPTVVGQNVNVSEISDGLWQFANVITLNPGESLTVRLRASVVGAIPSDFGIIASGGGSVFTGVAQGEVTFGLLLSVQSGNNTFEDEASFDLGSVNQGQTTTPLPLTLVNEFGDLMTLTLPPSGSGFITGNFVETASNTVNLDATNFEADFSIRLDSSVAGAFSRRYAIAVQETGGSNSAVFHLNLSGTVVATTPTVTITATDNTATEAGTTTGTYTVTRTGPTTEPLTVSYAITGTATEGNDFQALSGNVVIPAGQSSATITLTPVNDGAIEANETVVLTLIDVAAYDVGNPAAATVTILSDDLPTVSILGTDLNASESGDPGVVTVTRTGPTTSALVVQYSLAGSAGNGVDYQSLTGSVTIPAGQTSAAITVTPIDDAVDENDETVIVKLKIDETYLVDDGQASSMTVTIADNDGAAPTLPTVTVAASDNLAGESGDNTGAFTITRTGSTTAALTVNYTVSGTATAGSDYTALTGTVNIPAGSNSVVVTVTPINDSEVEVNETVSLTLDSNPAYQLGTAAAAVVTIVSEDVPTVTLSATDSLAAEGNAANPAVVRVSRTGSTALPLTVQLSTPTRLTTTSNLSAVVIPAGQAFVDVTFTLPEDSQINSVLSSTVTLQPSSAYTVGAQDSVTLQLTDNDGPDLTTTITQVKVGNGKTGLRGRAGDAVSLKFSVSNIAVLPTTAQGQIDIAIVARGPGGDVVLTTLQDQAINVTSGKSQKFAPKFTLPAGLAAGTYSLVVITDSGDGLLETRNDNNEAVLPGLTLEPIFVDYAAAIAKSKVGKTGQVTTGSAGSANVTLTNQGNIIGAGQVSGRLLAQPNAGGNATLISTVTNAPVNAKPLKAAKLNLKFNLPTLAPGSYRLVFVMDNYTPAPILTGLQDTGLVNNTGIGAVSFVVS